MANPLDYRMLLEGAGTGAKVDLQSLLAGENQTYDFMSVNTEGKKPTYSASTFGAAPPATPTDFFSILGSATKTIRILRLYIVGRATAASWYRVALRKYSTVYSGGTSAAVTKVSHDSADAAATATILTWSVLPTVGTLVGAVHDEMVPLNAAALTATQPFSGPPGPLWDFTTRNGRGIVLRGVGEYIALNGAGVALPAGTVFDIKAEISEE